jgi:hypothetical protein
MARGCSMLPGISRIRPANSTLRAGMAVTGWSWALGPPPYMLMEPSIPSSSTHRAGSPRQAGFPTPAGDSPSPSGLDPSGLHRQAIPADPSGNLFAGGDFTDANGNRYVAKLSGGVWSEPGLGGSKFPAQANPMHAMTVDTAGHAFVVLGDVDQAGIPIIERWQPSGWERISTSDPSGYSAITGLASDSIGNVYACGSFDAQPGAAKWNGSGWTVLPAASGQLTINSVNYIATDKKGRVYISGSFIQNSIIYNLAMWDGSAWHPIVSADIYYFIVDSAGTIYAANSDFSNSGYNVLKITGNSVLRIGGSGGNILNANTWVRAMVLDAAGNLYVGGGFSDNTGNAYVAKWDGNSWTELGTGPNGLQATGSITGLAFDQSGKLFASGNLMQHSGTYLGKWDGQSWTSVSGSSAFWYQNSIPFLCRDHKGLIYAGGQFNGSRGLNNYVYVYGDSNQTASACSSEAKVNLTASQTTITSQSAAVVITASIESGRGTGTTFAFSAYRDFSTLLAPVSGDSTLSIAASALGTGNNTIYVKMQTLNACQNTLIAEDSVTIVKTVINGIVDIDYPGISIIAFPIPMYRSLHITGLNPAKRYTLSLVNGAGMNVLSTRAYGSTNMTLDTGTLSQGTYWLEIVDDTRHRRLGMIAIVKIW